MTTTTLKAGYKMTEIGVIPEDWEVRNLGAIGEIKMCRRVFNHETKIIDNIPFYKIGTFGKEADAYISKSLYASYRKKFSFPRKGDILISAAGTIGRTVVYDGKPAYFQDSNIVWIDNNENLVFNSYLYYVYQVVKYDTEGGTIQRLYNSIIKNAEFAKPSKLEQTAIATVLSDTDELIGSLDGLIAKKRRIKEGAMQELLTGKKRLAGFSGEWEVKKLIEIANFYDNLRVPIAESKREDGITPYYGANGIQGYIKGHTHDGEFVLVAEDGANDLYNYPLLYVNGKIWVNNHAHVIQGTKECVNTKYLSYALKTVNFVQVLVGGTRAKLNGSVAKSIKIIIPNDIAEQQAIAQILSDMDAEITALQQKREKYKLVKQGLMQVLLTGKIRLI